ncbi:hypothetical protein ACGFZA_31865 [Streptomyces sp. NPDC048211]|uniref:hypothetical protein n=1 Tax=Streptomyces sp. NPDC048211 TaxID=3365516 RepID=UPI003720C8F8
MTTAAAPHRPSPADLATKTPAHQRAQERQAALLAPAAIPPTARFRVEFGRAIRCCGMTPNPRLVALTLAMFGNYRTGHIPEHRQPRLHGLAEATGLSAGQVVVALRVLESRGWISCQGSRNYDQGSLRAHIPQHAAASLVQHN